MSENRTNNLCYYYYYFLTIINNTILNKNIKYNHTAALNKQMKSHFTQVDSSYHNI